MKAFYLTADAAEMDCPEGWHVVALPGHSRWNDYYVLVEYGKTVTRVIPQSEAHRKYGVWDIVYYIGDWGFIPARKCRLESFIRSGRPITDDAREYLQGHRTPSEFWTGKINQRMEAARISHIICDTAGKDGHDARQEMRKEIREGKVPFQWA